MSDNKDFKVDFVDGVATLWMQLGLGSGGRANKINAQFGEGLAAVITEVTALEGLKGIILASGHKDFCVGADLDFVYGVRDPAELGQLVGRLHAGLRALETCGKPVVAAINGSALGGGYELAQACHYRVVIGDPRVQLGLPEVGLGVIPGGGGTQRLPRKIGLQKAMEYIAQGSIVRPDKALKDGLVDEVVADKDALFAAAHAWIAANPKAKQPWDSRGFKYPNGPQPDTPDARNLFAGGAAMLFKKTAGAYQAPEAAVKAIYEGTLVGFDAGTQIEARYFAQCVVSDQAKDMIRTFWYHRNTVAKQAGLPQTSDDRFKKVGILGAGMMGAGLAFVSALRGYDVVLKDIEQGSLDKGMAHIKGELGKRKHMSADEKQAVQDRIKGTLQNSDLVGCDLIIEAVFENKALKHRVIKEVEALLGEDAVFATNTSAIPITDLAEASCNKANFIGLHFFSPVEKMPLLEVISPEFTSDDTLARCLAYARAIKKTSIVVNDGYGFFTSRTFVSYVMEAAQLVAEGHDPVLIEWAARQAGMVVSPLKVFDEVTLSLAAHAFSAAEEYTGKSMADLAGVKLVKAMVAAGRLGKTAGQGFYDYSAQPRRLWSGLKDLVGTLGTSAPETTGVEYLARRLILAQALEAARCLDEGILKSTADGEIGAIMGVGFAPNTGGPFAWLDRQGIAEVVAELDGLGERFAPPKLLRDMAEKGERFFPYA